MPVSKEEKYLSSIDSTLKDILKELKRQSRTELIEINMDGKAIGKILDFDRWHKAQEAMKGYKI